jgi:hypothetical protein
MLLTALCEKCSVRSSAFRRKFGNQCKCCHKLPPEGRTTNFHIMLIANEVFVTGTWEF